MTTSKVMASRENYDNVIVSAGGDDPGRERLLISGLL